MSKDWYHARPRPVYSNFNKVSVSEEWFDVYEVSENLFVFYEPRHCEEAISNLVIGKNKAALIDTGCGIGDLRKAVEKVTNKPVVVVNTHTHSDHLGSNPQFDEIAMYDHHLSRQISEKGISHDVLRKEILDPNLVIKPWPQDFEPSDFFLPPFKVSRWLQHGDHIDIGNRNLEVIYTPGEAIDHICLLDRVGRVLFCGDTLVDGSVWTFLDGASIEDLIGSYQTLMEYFDDFDHVMPSHNSPWIDKNILPESLDGALKVVSGQAEYTEMTDPWGRTLKQYVFNNFKLLTPKKNSGD